MGPRAEPRVAGDRQQGKADQDALLFPSVCEEQSKANSISEFASQSIGDAKFAWTAWARERALKMKKKVTWRQIHSPTKEKEAKNVNGEINGNMQSD